jgi:hypothetical protein
MQAVGWTSGAELAWREPFGVAETPAEYVLHRPRLYLETTIPSYLTARMSSHLHIARRQMITSRWWNSWRTNFDIYVSDRVCKEASAGNPEAARRRTELLAPLKVLKVDAHAELLYRRIIAESGLPSRASEDALHVAVASVNEMQYLLTWNCAHLANPRFARKITALCESEGFSCPVPCTPEQLLEKYEHAHLE